MCPLPSRDSVTDVHDFCGQVAYNVQLLSNL